MAGDSSERERVWLVERTFSDDEQNLIILTYATPDGSQYFRKERALPSLTESRSTKAALTVDRQNLGDVTDPDEQERYARQVREVMSANDPDDTI